MIHSKMNHSKPFAGFVLFPLLAGLILAACDQADAARPPMCRDAAMTAAVVDAAARLRRAEDAGRRVAMGGTAYEAAKVGPIPGPDLDAAMTLAAEEIVAARENLVAVRRHCYAN